MIIAIDSYQAINYTNHTLSIVNRIMLSSLKGLKDDFYYRTEYRKNAIIIIAVIHDDVPESTRKTIYADHFHPLVSELESFTERKVNVIFTGGEPYSNFDYKGNDTIENGAKMASPWAYKLLE